MCIAMNNNVNSAYLPKLQYRVTIVIKTLQSRGVSNQ